MTSQHYVDKKGSETLLFAPGTHVQAWVGLWGLLWAYDA